MSNGKDQLQQVNWSKVFGFSHIFKSFRMARQPSKVLLAMMFVIVIFLSGHVLDTIWSWAGQRVQDGDIMNYCSQSSEQYEDRVEKWQDPQERLEAAAKLRATCAQERHNLMKFAREAQLIGTPLGRAIAEELNKYNDEHEKDYKPVSQTDIITKAKDNNKSYTSVLSDAESDFQAAKKKIRTLIESGYDAAKEKLESDTTLKEKEDDLKKALNDLKLARDDAERAVVSWSVDFKKSLTKIRGRKVFESFLAYEVSCFENALDAVRHGYFLTGMDAYEAMLNRKAIPSKALPDPATPGAPAIGARVPAGFFYWMLMALQGIIWLLCQHTVFAVVFLVIALSAWALFGGAIHRIAALHSAREEMISMFQALAFARDKFLSFFFAPLLPLGIIVLLGALIAVGGLIGSIPGLNIIVLPILVLIGLVFGAVIAFMAIGLIAGGPLMYPTIAVEGSDTFDALNRGVSYVFGRPWRALLYGLVALVGGAIWYLFARMVAFLVLTSTHWFMKIGVYGGGQDLAKDADKLDLVWPAPTFSDLHPSCSWEAMSGGEAFIAFVIAIWVYLVIAAVAAVVLSYFVSAATNIYFLLRQKVDATDLDDVYVEEVEEEYPQEAQPEQEKPEPAQEEQPKEEPEAPKATEEPAAPEEPAEGESSEEDPNDEKKSSEGDSSLFD